MEFQPSSCELNASDEVKRTLHESLAQTHIGGEVILLDYPDYVNIGDHLIWLGSISYLLETLGVQIRYTASSKTFSHEYINKLPKNAVIILNGGGNLGDTYSDIQNFREHIITEYKDRPIVVFPQTIHFQNSSTLEKTKRIFNSHPNLTIFVRDHYSYGIALKEFSGCKVFMAPDMAFQLAGKPEFSNLKRLRDHDSDILYIYRQDKESNFNIDPKQINISGLTVGDWISYQDKWVMGYSDFSAADFRMRLKRTLASFYREFIQRGITSPVEALSRSKYLQYSSFSKILGSLYDSQRSQQSLSFSHAGIYQFQKYKLVVTNRLHGHILCSLLEIPHVFLPNSYYKNIGFHEAWTSNVEYCRFVQDIDKIQPALEELMQIYYSD